MNNNNDNNDKENILLGLLLSLIIQRKTMTFHQRMHFMKNNHMIVILFSPLAHQFGETSFQSNDHHSLWHTKSFNSWLHLAFHHFLLLLVPKMMTMTFTLCEMVLHTSSSCAGWFKCETMVCHQCWKSVQVTPMLITIVSLTHLPQTSNPMFTDLQQTQDSHCHKRERERENTGWKTHDSFFIGKSSTNDSMCTVIVLPIAVPCDKNKNTHRKSTMKLYFGTHNSKVNYQHWSFCCVQHQWFFPIFVESCHKSADSTGGTPFVPAHSPVKTHKIMLLNWLVIDWKLSFPKNVILF